MIRHVQKRHAFVRHGLLSLAMAACVAGALRGDESTDATKSLMQAPVGMPARVQDLVIPGSELEALPIEDRKTAVVVRIVATYRHGSDYRYDLEVYGLEPGRHDLRNYLRRKDRSEMGAVPSLWIDVESRLPPGHLLPSEVKTSAVQHIGGYRMAMIGLFAVWTAIVMWLLLSGRRRRPQEQVQVVKEPSPAELLRPLVLDAVAGRISAEKQAELERQLLRYWRRRLKLEDANPVAALAAIREHPQAGALLRQVEDWLHRPGGAQGVDIASVLRPYENPPDVLDESPPAAVALGA